MMVGLEVPSPGIWEEFTSPSFGVQLLCYLYPKAVQNLWPFVGSEGPPSPKVPMFLGNKILCPRPALEHGGVIMTFPVLVSGGLVGVPWCCFLGCPHGDYISGSPFPRWDDAFCREIIRSRVETTKTLAKAIADAEQPPHAWVVVTGVGIGWAWLRHDSC